MVHGDIGGDFDDGLFLDSCPQPFDVSVSRVGFMQEKRCRRVFCGCGECVQEQRLFSEAIKRSKRSGTARDALSCEDGVPGPGGIAAKASAGRELLRTDEVAFCVGALASDGLKVEGIDMQGADSKQANVGSKHMFGDFGLKGPDG